MLDSHLGANTFPAMSYLHTLLTEIISRKFLRSKAHIKGNKIRNKTFLGLHFVEGDMPIRSSEMFRGKILRSKPPFVRSLEVSINLLSVFTLMTLYNQLLQVCKSRKYSIQFLQNLVSVYKVSWWLVHRHQILVIFHQGGQFFNDVKLETKALGGLIAYSSFFP